VTGQVKPVLLAFDGSPSSAAAIAVAGRLMPGRKVLVCHVGRDAKLAVDGSELARAAGLDAEPFPQPKQRKTWRALSSTVTGMAAELDEVADEQSEDRVSEGLQVAKRAGFDGEASSEQSTGPTWHNRRPVLVVSGEEDR
jgi:hypothetical protein